MKNRIVLLTVLLLVTVLLSFRKTDTIHIWMVGDSTMAAKNNTHFGSFSANEVAKCVVQGIRDLKLDNAKNIKTTVPNYNPKNPAKFID